MKKLLIFIICLIPLLGMAQKSPVDKLFDKYANKKGLTTVNISGALLGLASQIDNQSAEAKMLSDLDGVRILAVDDDDLNREVDFYKELENDGFFKNHDYEVLMEVTEENEVVRFFARSAGNGKFSELLLVVGGDDNALISIRGLIDPENIGKITGALDLDVMPKEK
ncbi:DUF4252 domain-containing protein [Sunxiuqinia elliptica]|uniref:Uncharacterized protein DUF4252 n=1 Tax=Sunxiuqinia elliptica TaxID=655355 RepID=A0A1I2KAK7_9BACT|nr:DUF4252 domain-containing protein [Sunxiuqinia elliptica]TDN96200.1 uncharacterized protein DUF4252 [Sunxiuqinia elliptica]TDO67911.1 uncharacterized protein DUF4252 [Sunxiuqinia elliptica]SFF64142.1 protein of unknown function [Sunxiuqinia elliptica]